MQDCATRTCTAVFINTTLNIRNSEIPHADFNIVLIRCEDCNARLETTLHRFYVVMSASFLLTTFPCGSYPFPVNHAPWKTLFVPNCPIPTIDTVFEVYFFRYDTITTRVLIWGHASTLNDVPTTRVQRSSIVVANTVRNAESDNADWNQFSLY